MRTSRPSELGLGRKIMVKKLVLAPSCLVLALVVSVGIYIVDGSKNRGFHFGYYGQYNRIIDAIERLPEYELIKAHANLDGVLEEIWLDIKTKDGETIKMFIGQNEEYRKLKGEALADELRMGIRKARSNKAGYTTTTHATAV